MTSPPRTTPRPPKKSPQPENLNPVAVTADLPGFHLPPSPPAEQTPAPATPVDGDAASVFAGHDVPVPPSTAGSSSPASTDGAKPVKVVPTDPTLYIELGTVAFAGIGLVLHQRLTPGDDHDAFIPDQQDTAAVVTPLASIAARRSPLVGGAANDVTDGLVALIGGIGYVMKSLTKWREAKRHRKQTSGWTGQAQTGGAPATHTETEPPPPEPFVTFDPGASPLSGLGTHLGD